MRVLHACRDHPSWTLAGASSVAADIVATQSAASLVYDECMQKQGERATAGEYINTGVAVHQS